MSSRSKIYKLKETPAKSVENGSGLNGFQVDHDEKDKGRGAEIPIEADDNQDDTNCGMGSCQPECLQCFANIKVLVFFYGLLSACTQTNATYLSSQITAIEKQFQLSSTLSGSLLSCNEIGQLVFVLLVSHFGHKGHIPRIIGCFTFLYGLGMLGTAMPSYFSGYTLPKEASNISSSDTYTRICSAFNRSDNSSSATETNVESNGDSLWALYAIGTCIVIQGIGKSATRPLTSTHVDNNIPDRTKTGFYLGIIVSAAIFGPSIAVMIGSGASAIPVDLSDTSLKTSDPRWVGCWWLGFVIFGLYANIFSIPVMFFPRRLKNAAPVPSSADKASVKEKEERKLSSVVKEFPRTLLRVLRRPIFTLTLTAVCFVSFTLTGTFYFGPKYIQNQFLVPAWKANLIHGITHLIVSVMGTFIGGLLTSKLKMDNYKCSKFILLIAFTGFAFNTGLVFVGCDDKRIVGLDVNTTQPNDGLEPMEPTCFCDRTTFLPVCGQDQKNYLNPCVAQCWNKTDTTYGGCMEVEGGSATLGFCDTGCSSLIVYMALDVIQSCSSSLAIMPCVLLIMRSVEERDKTVAVGLQVFSTSILGWLPAPIVYGSVIDGACRFWNYKNGKRGSCALYYLETLRTHFLGMEALFRFMCFLLFIFITLLCRRKWRIENRDREVDSSKENTNVNTMEIETRNTKF